MAHIKYTTTTRSSDEEFSIELKQTYRQANKEILKPSPQIRHQQTSGSWSVCSTHLNQRARRGESDRRPV